MDQWKKNTLRKLVASAYTQLDIAADIVPEARTDMHIQGAKEMLGRLVQSLGPIDNARKIDGLFRAPTKRGN